MYLNHNHDSNDDIEFIVCCPTYFYNNAFVIEVFIQ